MESIINYNGLLAITRVKFISGYPSRNYRWRCHNNAYGNNRYNTTYLYLIYQMEM